jgi:protoporphyrinogen oxidase
VRVAVLGAGVAGLTAARRLGLAGHEVDVYERWPGLGGMAATVDVGGGHRLERYYHHLFTSDRHIAALYDELGLPDELEWRDSTQSFFVGGKQWPFTSPLDLLRFRPLSFLTRLRMGVAVLAVQKFGKDPTPYEQVTARDWIRRRMGAGAWDVVWGPLLRAKFGARADEISMVWLWSKFTLRRQLEGEEARGEKLGYPIHSWELLLERLAGEVRAHGRVLVNRPAARVEAADGGFLVHGAAADSFRRGHDPRAFAADGEPERYDAVLSTLPNDIMLQLCGNLLPLDYAAKLHGVDYYAALCLLLEVRDQVSPFYWTNVADPDLPFLGLIEHTNFVEPERYDGRRFVYVANYLPQDHELLGLTLDEVLERYVPGLQRINPAFSRDWIVNAWLFQEPAAQPIVTLGYRERIPPLQTGVPGLVLANTTQVYPEDRGTNYAVRIGEEAAQALMTTAR